MQAHGQDTTRKGYGNMSNDNEWLDSETDDIKAIVHNTVEFTMIDRLSEEEIITLLSIAKAHNIKTIVSNQDVSYQLVLTMCKRLLVYLLMLVLLKT